ncbi:MAG TPA: GlcNAc-PI de-N-acetylase [Anaerolineales bacterium]|nr:GlcNAc-PI de-N-acetylase [Anaerolineae bacterium]HIQ02591.1 GlcNAc-PI de-N-acetylase [Anaerolineales bacterium]
MPAMVEQIYLSPHLDDVALSCGGRIRLQVRAGVRVRVVTVFAGGLAGALTPFAQALHHQWGLGRDAPAARRAEDRAALALLGAEPTHWNLPECIYRSATDGAFLYPTWEALWGPLHPADGPLLKELARRIGALPEAATLYVPLGAGGHVDHRLVRRAAEAAARPLLYYEEYPYAEDPRAVEAALEGARWEPEPVFLDEEVLEAKIAAVACYRSQLSTFWADEAEMAEHLRAYGLQVGGGRLAERYWRRR